MKGPKGRRFTTALKQKWRKGFKIEARERVKVHEELTNMEDEIKAVRMGSRCAVSSAAKHIVWIGIGYFCKTFSFCTERKEIGAEENRNQRNE